MMRITSGDKELIMRMASRDKALILRSTHAHQQSVGDSTSILTQFRVVLADLDAFGREQGNLMISLKMDLTSVYIEILCLLVFKINAGVTRCTYTNLTHPQSASI